MPRYTPRMSRLPALMKLHAAEPTDADLLFMIASEHVAAGAHAEAITWLARYVEAGRDVGAGWALLADCHAALGDDAGRLRALEAGITAALAGGHPTLAAELRDRIESGE